MLHVVTFSPPFFWTEGRGEHTVRTHNNHERLTFGHVIRPNLHRSTDVQRARLDGPGPLDLPLTLLIIPPLPLLRLVILVIADFHDRVLLVPTNTADRSSRLGLCSQLTLLLLLRGDLLRTILGYVFRRLFSLCGALTLLLLLLLLLLVLLLCRFLLDEVLCI